MTARDLRPPAFRRAVHIDDLSNPKRPRIETRHRESIIAPGKRIEASDRTYFTDSAGSLRRVHREGDQVSIVSRRSKAKATTKAQQKCAARIEAAIAKRETKRARRLAAPEKAAAQAAGFERDRQFEIADGEGE